MKLWAPSVAAMLVFLCLTYSTVRAQIKTETRVVLVDTIVTGKQGEYIHDLAAKDFHVWEDNKEQTIKSVTVERGLAATPSRQRYLVLFFAGIEATDRIAARQAVSGFIDANANENRLMAVLSFNGGLRIAQNFTANATRLKGAVTAALSSDAVSGAADSGALDTIRALRSLARNLGALPGRKTLIFVSGGLSQSSIQRAELTDAIDACNKSDVAVYPIDVRPLSAEQFARPTAPFGSAGDVLPAQRAARRAPTPSGPDADSDARIPDAGTTNQQLLFRLASGTGGFVVANAADLQGGLQRVGEEQGEYYVLSYTPAELKEGVCHTLRVKVDRSGARVRARTNYCESKPEDLLAGTVAGQDLERRAAAAQTGGIGASMQLSYFYVSPNVARVNLAMEIPPDALKFEKTKGKSGKAGTESAEINFLGVATAPDGGVGARFSDALKLDPDGKGKPLHYEKEFKIVPGHYNFTMAFSAGGENFGKLEAPLTIDIRQAGELSLSGLVLSREAHPAAELGLGLAGLVETRTPLVTDDTQIVPSGSNQFTKSEQGFFYFEAYSSDPASVQVSVRVLDRKSGQSRWDSGLMRLSLPKSGGDAIPGGSRLPIDLLPVGSYKLEVTATDAAGKQVRRTADFEVR